MDLRLYVGVVRRRWWLLLLGPLLAAVVAFAISKQMTPIYAATSTILVNNTQVSGAIQYNDILSSERLTNTYAALLKRQQVLSVVHDRLGLTDSVAQLYDKISVSTVKDTQLLRIKVLDESPDLAASIANATAMAFIDENTQSLGRPGTVTIADEAQVPHAPAKPNTKLNTFLAAILGVIVVGGIVFVLEYLDDTVKVMEDSEGGLGLPTLGVIQRLRRDKRGMSRLIANEASEAFVQLRTNVHFAGVGTQLRRIVVTSASPGDGKSTVSSGLAVLLAQAGERVVLVDTDLRRPTLHRIFNVSNSFGLTGLLLSNARSADVALVESETKNLQILPSGPVPPNPADLLMSNKMGKILDTIPEDVDYVIFDCPPILAVTDASILAGLADGTILVAEAGKTRKPALRRAVYELSRTHARVLGVVLNKVARKASQYYYYEYQSQRPPSTPSGPDQPATRRREHGATRAASRVDEPAA